MKLNDKTIDTLGKSLRYLHRLPEGTCFNFDYSGSLQIEAETQADVKAIRQAFRGTVWKKEFVEWAQRWVYTTTTRTGVNVRINGIKEGPAQCKMVETVEMEERSVPIGYRKEMIEVKKVKYICPDGNKVK